LMKIKGIICLLVLLELVINQNLNCPELVKESASISLSDLHRKYIIN